MASCISVFKSKVHRAGFNVVILSDTPGRSESGSDLLSGTGAALPGSTFWVTMLTVTVTDPLQLLPQCFDFIATGLRLRIDYSTKVARDDRSPLPS